LRGKKREKIRDFGEARERQTREEKKKRKKNTLLLLLLTFSFI